MDLATKQIERLNKTIENLVSIGSSSADIHQAGVIGSQVVMATMLGGIADELARIHIVLRNS